MSAGQLIGVAEAAQRLSVSRRSLERRIAEGQIKCVKIGRRTLIALQELDAFIRRQTKVAT